MIGQWLRFRETKCDNCGWSGRLEWHAPCPGCGASDNTTGIAVPTENERQLALYLEEQGQGELAGGRAWFENPAEVRVIPRRPTRTATATATRQGSSHAIIERARAMRLGGSQWKDIGTALDRDPEYLRKAVKRLPTAVSSDADVPS